jgi:hypothetical protein
VTQQDMWVTTFWPPWAGKPSDLGMTEFSRVELLAHLAGR